MDSSYRGSFSIPANASSRASQRFHGSASFKMFKDIETKEEYKKLKIAGFLRELHKLALEEAKEKVVSEINESTRKRAPASQRRPEGAGKGDGTLSLSDVDLSLLTPSQAKEKIEALHAGEKIDSDSLILLTQAAMDLLATEETVVDVRKSNPGLKTVTVVGDLHGSLNCLMSVLKLIDIWGLEKTATSRVVVFDGDFVDRGAHSLEVLSTLMLLKLSHPTNVFMLRGNHEDSMTASTYGFRDEIEEKHGLDLAAEIWFYFEYLFASLPVIARSSQAAIMHGGIPMEDFRLDDASSLDKKIRCELRTVVDPYDDDEGLVSGILWSDPYEENGLFFSDRGAGYMYGPDVSKGFLDREGLKYIIRAHEPFEDGTNFQEVGDGKGVITIFSTANYPNGKGTNKGAVLFLDEETGEYHTPSFIHEERSEPEADAYNSWLMDIVDANRSKLVKAFRQDEDSEGTVTVEQWAQIVATALELKEVAWKEIQADLAPTTEPSGTQIDWKVFIDRFSAKVTKTDNLSEEQLKLLHENKDRVLDIFQLWDTDSSGTLSEEEFAAGITMVNEQMLVKKVPIEDPVKLFRKFDTDGNGEINLDEFCQALKFSSTLQGLTASLDLQQVESLQQHNEMLLMTFKYLDADRSGAIDRTEFQKGFDLLNKRLPERNKLGNAGELFELLDEDGNGEIDLNEFISMIRTM